MNQAFHLYQLQKVDLQIINIQNRIDQIEAIIAKEDRIEKAEGMLRIAIQKLDKTKKELRGLEEIGKSIRTDIETNEASMYSGKVRNPKELADIQQKVNFDKKNRDKNDDAQLDLIMEIENREPEIIELQKLLQQVQSEVATSHSLLLGEKSQLEKQKATLETERHAKSTSINEDSLSIYSRLLKQKHGTAVALVEERSCASCGEPLTPAEWQLARSSAAMSFCSSCGRILFAK
jgi:predicted  nucleic acid-binding Zn-ribbon protein